MSRLAATLRISRTWLVSSSAVIVGDTWGRTHRELGWVVVGWVPGIGLHPSSHPLAWPSFGNYLQGDAAVRQLLFQVNLDDEVPCLRELGEERVALVSC